jgi:hypothetical protein
LRLAFAPPSDMVTETSFRIRAPRAFRFQ